MHFNVTLLAALREVVLFDLVGFFASLFWVSVVCVSEVCCDCSFWTVLSSWSSRPSSSESVCRWVGCCSSGVAGVHHGHKNVSSVTGILSLLMHGL